MNPDEICIYDLPPGNDSIRHFIISHGIGKRYIVKNGALRTVYDKKQLIGTLEDLLEKYRGNSRMQRFYKKWENHLKVIKEL